MKKMYSKSKPASCEQFLDHLDKLPWCKQGESKLVAVHHCSPAVIEVLRHHDHDLKVYPGAIHIKLNKSTLSMLEEKFAAEQPVPLLLVWTKDGVEMSFRTHKSADFPYDIWQNPAAAAYERESVFIVAEELGEQSLACLNKHLAAAKTCPVTIPPL
jgi:hypothetical protein